MMIRGVCMVCLLIQQLRLLLNANAVILGPHMAGTVVLILQESQAVQSYNWQACSCGIMAAMLQQSRSSPWLHAMPQLR